MEYTLRKIKSRDIGKVCKIISKIGIQEIVDNLNMKKIISDVGNEEDTEDTEDAKDAKEKQALLVGVQVALACGDIVLKNIDRCIGDVLDYLEDLSGIDKNIIDDDPALMMSMIMDYFKKEEFKDFFKVVSKFISKKTI